MVYLFVLRVGEYKSFFNLGFIVKDEIKWIIVLRLLFYV